MSRSELAQTWVGLQHALESTDRVDAAAPWQPRHHACHAESVTPETADLTLSVTGDIEMLHTTECPHLGTASLAALVPATTEQLEELPVCSSCRGILDGARRSTYTTLDQALEAFQMPLENRPRAREVAAGLAFSRVWIPASGSYIGVGGPPGTPAAAYFGKGYVALRLPEGGYETEWLPVNGAGGGRSSSGHAERVNLCSTCFTQLPATNVCDNCVG